MPNNFSENIAFIIIKTHGENIPSHVSQVNRPNIGPKFLLNVNQTSQSAIINH